MSDSEPRLAVGYAKVSIEEENIENQVLEIERFAKSMGYILIEVFKDIGVSDSVPTLQREGFRNMLTWLETTPKVVRTIIVYDLTRLGRNAKDIMEVYDYLTSRGYNILFVKNPELNITIDSPFSDTIRRVTSAVMSAMAELERKMISERTKTAQPQQQEQVEKPAEQQQVQEQAEVRPPTTAAFPRGDFKVRSYHTTSFNEAVLGLPVYAPVGGVKLVVQRSRYFPTPDKAENAWSAVVFTYSVTYSETSVIVPEPHVITCRNLATCVREGLLALYKYSNKQTLELLAKSGINSAKLYADPLLLPVCVVNTDKMCMNIDILVLDPDWPGGFAQVKNTGIEIQVRAVPANDYELFIQSGKKPIFHKYTLALTPNGTYIVTWEKMNVT